MQPTVHTGWRRLCMRIYSQPSRKRYLFTPTLECMLTQDFVALRSLDPKLPHLWVVEKQHRFLQFRMLTMFTNDGFSTSWFLVSLCRSFLCDWSQCSLSFCQTSYQPDNLICSIKSKQKREWCQFLATAKYLCNAHPKQPFTPLLSGFLPYTTQKEANATALSDFMWSKFALLFCALHLDIHAFIGLWMILHLFPVNMYILCVWFSFWKRVSRRNP